MLHVPDVLLPRKNDRVLGSAKDETPIGHSARDLNEETLHQRLAIASVGSEIGEVCFVTRERRSWMMNVGVNTAEKRNYAASTKFILQGGQCSPTCVTQDQIKVGEFAR